MLNTKKYLFVAKVPSFFKRKIFVRYEIIVYQEQKEKGKENTNFLRSS